MVESQKQMDQLKKAMAEAPEDQKAIFKQTLDIMQQAMNEMTATSGLHDSDANLYMRQAYEQSLEEYNLSLARWEQEYPANKNTFVKLRLQQYLELLPTVDFSAKLKTEDKVRKFVDPAYESKSWLWKSCYRAGKAANQAAERVVRSWLADLR